MKVLRPESWPRPSGYANGISASGRMIFVSGVVGRDAQETFATGFVAQFRQILLNTLAILATDAAGADSIVRMTWFVRDIDVYKTNLGEIGAIWRELLGNHYPAMAVLGVADLVDAEALLEIETTAIIS